MIKLIIFDFGGVLGSDANDWQKTFSKILSQTGLTTEDLHKIWNLYSDQMNIGKYDIEIFFEDVSKAGRKKTSAKELLSIYEDCIWLNTEVVDLANELKLKGFELTILSNESKTGMNFKIKKFDLHSIFQKIYCSADLGFVKPEERAFVYVLEDLKAIPQTTLLIDDRKENIDVAKKLGMATIMYKNIKQLRTELKSMGVL